MTSLFLPRKNNIKVGFTQSFGSGTTTAITLPVSATQSIPAITILTLVRPTTIDSTSRYVYSLTDNAAQGGPRLIVVDTTGTKKWTFVNAISTTTGEAGEAGVALLNQWQFVACSQDGLNYPVGGSAKIYFAVPGTPLVDVTTPINWNWGTPLGGVGYPTTIGNRNGGSREFKGDIAYVARWNRVLSLQELNRAKSLGPLSVPKGLIMLWANGKDYGPYHLHPTSVTDVTKASSSFTLLKTNSRLISISEELIRSNKFLPFFMFDDFY